MRKKESYNKKKQKIKVNSAARYLKRIFRWENKKTFLRKENKDINFKRKWAEEQLWKKFEIQKRMCFFTTRIYRSLHSITSVIDKKTERIENRSTFDQKNFMFKFITTKYFLKAEQDMCYFKSAKNSKYIHKKLKKHDETSDACEFLKEFKNTNEVREFYEKVMKMNEIQNFKCNEHRWINITRTIRICQKHEIESDHTDINNKNTIILYNSKSAVNYISLNCEFRLRALEEINVVKKNNENIITVLECDDLSNMIFRRKRDSANYLMISAAHSNKSSLNILKKDDDLKEKKLRSYTSIKSIHIIKIILCNRRVITIIHKEHKRSYIIKSLWKDIFLEKTFHFNRIIELINSNEFEWKKTIIIKES